MNYDINEVITELRELLGPDVHVGIDRSEQDGVPSELGIDPSGCGFAGLRHLWIERDVAAGHREAEEHEDLLLRQVTTARRIWAGLRNRERKAA